MTSRCLAGVRRRRPNRGLAAKHGQWLLFGVLGAATAVLVLLRQIHFGPGLTPDAADYLSAARNLAQGDGIVPFHTGSYAVRPPLFPLVLAAGGVFGLEVIRVAAVVNALAFGTAVILIAHWLRRRHASPWLCVWAGLAGALSLPLAGVAAHIWSESLFLCLALLALALLDRHLLDGGEGGRALLLSAIAAALCCLTRYMGFAVVACAVAALLILGQGPFKAKALRIVAYAAGAVAPAGVWLIRGWIDAPPGGYSWPRGFDALDAFDTGVSQALLWIAGPGLRTGLTSLGEMLGVPPGRHAGAALWKLAAFGVCAGLFAWGLARFGRPGAWRVILVPGCFALAYLTMLAIAMPVRGNFAELRLFAPAHAPVLLLLALGAGEMLAGGRAGRAGGGGQRPRIIGIVAALALTGWLAQWAAANRTDIRQWLNHGSDGYGARQWRHSETVAHLKGGGLPTGMVFSNDPFALYLLVAPGARPVGNRCPPRRTCFANVSAAANIRPGSVLRQAADAGAHIVWLHRPRTGQHLDLTTLVTALPTLNVVAVLADGVVFRLGPERPAGDAATRLARALLRQAGERLPPAAQGKPHYDVHLSGKRMTYVRRGCAAADVEARFFLHVVPRDPNLLPAGQPFANLDFDFAPRGLLHNGRCLATAQLPDYPLAEVDTGQWNAKGELWRAHHPLGTPRTPPPKRGPNP